MTQPPDDRFPPPSDSDPSPDAARPPSSEPVASGDEATTPDNAPTVAWSPPETETAAGTAPPGPPEATTTDPPPAEPPPPPPTSPIISADAGAPQAGWQMRYATPPTPAAGGGGWVMPTSGGTVAVERPGFVISSMGARFVAWLIDGLLASLVPVILFFYVFDWQTFFRQVIDQMQFDANGNVIPNYGATYTIPFSTDLVLVTLIGLGVQFIYFVGFWTSRWQATPGQIGLKIRVVDANTGGTLTVVQASKRFVALGYPLALLVVVPVLQSAASLAQFALTVFLFFSTVTNDRRQGLHDKFANSLVIRSVTSGSGATVVGCLVFGVLVILITIVASVALFSVMSPFFVEMIDRFPRSAT